MGRWTEDWTVVRPEYGGYPLSRNVLKTAWSYRVARKTRRDC
jgi:hypothetical protein